MSTSKRRSLKSELGFIEIEYMIAGALVTILIMAVMGALAMMHRFQRANDASADSYYMLNSLIATVKTEDKCTQALQGAIIPTSVGMETPVSIPVELPNVGMTTLAAGPGEIIPGVRITTLSLLYNPGMPSTMPPPPPQTVTLINGTVLTQHLVNIRLATQKLADGQPAGFTAPKDIPVPVLVDAGNRIQYCEIDAGEARVCAESGGMWDPSAPRVHDPTNPRCKSTDHCDYGGSFSISEAFTNGHGGYVNPLTGGFGCPAGFTQQRTGTISSSRQCGKECVENFFYPTYTCMRCNPGLADMALQPMVRMANPSITSFINAQNADMTTQRNNIRTTLFGIPIP